MKSSFKKDTNNFTRKSYLVLAVAAILSLSIISSAGTMSNVVNAQTNNNITATSNNQTQLGQLKFFLKLSDSASPNGTQTASNVSEGQNTDNLKNVTVNVNVQQGQEQPKKLPITALVPKETSLEQLELCATVGDKPEQCQPLSGENISLDLSGQQGQNTAGNDSTPSSDVYTQQQSYLSPTDALEFKTIAFNHGDNYGLSNAVYSPHTAYYLPVQLVDDVNVNVPIDIDVTAIIPIDVDIENAQVCANLGGTQTCQINNINPTTNEYSPTTIDLASQEPAVTTQSAPTTTEPASTAPTTTEPAPTTTEPAPTTSPDTSSNEGSSDTSSNEGSSDTSSN